jgi:5' nucleotidase family
MHTFEQVLQAVWRFTQPAMHALLLLCMLYTMLYRYLLPSPDLKAILQRLRDSGKQLFICSNSPWYFVDAGMRHLMGPDWVRTSKQTVCQRLSNGLIQPLKLVLLLIILSLYMCVDAA